MNTQSVTLPWVLVAEDRGLVAAKIQRALERGGFAVAGPTATLEQASLYAERWGERLVAAVLDIDLRGQPVYPVAERLAARGTPLVFVTGYGLAVIEAPWRDHLRIEKPFESAVLIETVRRAIAGVKPPARPASTELVMTPAVRRAWETMRQTRDIITETRAYRELTNPLRPNP